MPAVSKMSNYSLMSKVRARSKNKLLVAKNEALINILKIINEINQSVPPKKLAFKILNLKTLSLTHIAVT